MEVIKVTKEWQRAASNWVRIKTMVEGKGIAYDIEFDDDNIENPDYFLVLDEEKPVATCRVEYSDTTTAKIERVIVIPEYQGKGVGRLMITEVEKKLRTYGYNKSFISSRETKVGFYEKLGYTPDWDGLEEHEVFNCVPTQKYLDVLDIDAVQNDSSNEYIKWLDEYLYDPAFRAGSAKTQESYEENYDKVFDAIDKIEDILLKKKYITGDEITKADVFLYSFLVRFEAVYYFAFRLNRNKLRDLNNIWRYVRELYSIESFAKKTYFEEIKKEYYLALDDERNPYHLVPDGPDVTDWSI